MASAVGELMLRLPKATDKSRPVMPPPPSASCRLPERPKLVTLTFLGVKVLVPST